MLAFVLVTSLFFMWAIAHNMNDILIRQFQKALDLSRGQSGFIQFAFYLGYFFMALPAGYVMKRFGYKNGILLGLLFYMAGALLFYPAAEAQSYLFFLVALFVIASGLTFLETAANPYITVMGNPEKGPQRLNLAQSFNGLGAAVAPLLGGLFIFSGIELSETELNAMSTEALNAYRAAEARAVQVPYLVIAAIVGLIALLIFLTKMPHIIAPSGNAVPQDGRGRSRIRELMSSRQLKFAVLAQFFYVGAQVCIWSYFIDYCIEVMPDTPEKTAAYYLSLSLFFFMIGRFLGTFLMHFVSPTRLLAAYAVIAVALCTTAVVADGMPAVIALGLISPCMSIMFPTIFALGIRGLGGNTEIGSSLIIMAIIGGAIFPPCMGFFADFATVQLSVLLPLTCFVVVFLFALYEMQSQEPV
ncbi:MAG TPA: L-fucose:H+ symporter permease [Gammaproteobacteria bacterium]